MSNEERSKKACKVWDASRSNRKAVTVTSLEELKIKGKAKLGLYVTGESSLRVVLESDGTQVDEDTFFRTMPDHTIFMFLRPEERWTTLGREHSRSALASIPRVVYEALNLLHVHQEAPEWKLMDNHGRLTLVLQWDQPTKVTDQGVTFCDVSAMKSSGSKEVSEGLPVVEGESVGHAFTTIGRDGRLETTINNVQNSASRSKSKSETPMPTCSKDCEFHCCALHQETRLTGTSSIKRDQRHGSSKVRFDEKRKVEQSRGGSKDTNSEMRKESSDSDDPEGESYPLEDNEVATSDKVQWMCPCCLKKKSVCN